MIHHRAIRSAVLLLVFAALLAGCSAVSDSASTYPTATDPTTTGQGEMTMTSRDEARTSRAETTTPRSDTTAAGTTLALTVAGRSLPVELDDSTPAADLVARLPVTLSFRDFGGQEKIADLDTPLDVTGAPEGADPQANEIGYYVPDQVLVLYYADIGYYSGIVRLGRMAAEDMAFVRSQPDGFEVTITR